jgi:hypothetical protein
MLSSSDGSFVGAYAITTSNTTVLSPTTRAITVTGNGNISIEWTSGVTTVEPVVSGVYYYYKVRKVLTNSTATGIRGYY